MPVHNDAKQERIWQVVRAFEIGRPHSLVVVIPKSLRDYQGLEPGMRFVVKTDEKDRILLERLDEGPEGSSFNKFAKGC